jgi:geranylgeranyl diphosphate synthase type I
VETVAGQYLDVLGENDPASWSVHRALRVAPADEPLVSAYTRYGLAVGEAFQLRDDLLGVYGDPAATGKPAGDDLRTGKPTTLLMLARELATPAQLTALERAADGPVDTLAGLIAETGAVTRVEQMIAERVSDALAALDAAPVDQTARTALTGLATAAANRRA